MKYLLIPILLLPALAQASTVLALSEEDLTARADTIVVGTVVQSVVHQTPNGNISTQVEVEVQQALRGVREGDVIRVEVPGGTWHGVTFKTDGAPTLVPGQVYVLFLETHGAIKRPIGFSLGVFQVAQGNTGWQVGRDLSGLSLMGNGRVNKAPELFSRFLMRVQTRVRFLQSGSAR